MNETEQNVTSVPVSPPQAPVLSDLPDLPDRPNVPPPSATKPASFHAGIVSRLRNYFLTGLILVGPLYITINLTWWFINWVDDLVRPFIPVAYRPETYLPVHIPGWGLIVALTTLTALGFLTANFVGRKLVETGETILNSMPVVRPIYKSLKQIFETLFAKTGSSFRRVGLVEFPSPGMWSLVFVSNPASEDIAVRLPETEHVAAFMPCTPNPTTGIFLLCAAPRHHRSRHHRRAGDDFADVGRHGSARRQRPAEAHGRARGSGAGCASRTAAHQHSASGVIFLIEIASKLC